MKIIWMLPARSGSKGLPDKNIKDLCGKPLMAYAIEAIKNSEAYQRHDCSLIVNTDSEQYARIAKQCGADVPFLRPRELAEDSTVVFDVMKHTAEYFHLRGITFDLFALIQITSPFLRSADIDDAIREFETDNTLDSVISVTESEVMPLWCNTLDAEKNMGHFLSDNIKRKNRQELPVYYRLTGSIRITKWKNLYCTPFDWYAGKSKAVVIAQENSLDIDTPMDFSFAEFLMQKRLGTL